jgi:hypothetical protein
MSEPVCRFLRTKKMFVPEQAEAARQEIETGIGHSFYWCNRTLREIGEDDAPVCPLDCRSGRKCFEA